MQPHTPPSSPTLPAHLETSDGRPLLAGKPALLVDAAAFEQLRQTLLQQLGPVATRATLTRFGFEQGWQIATRLGDRCFPLEQSLWLAQNQYLPYLSGFHRFAENSARLFSSAGWTLLESAEASIQLSTGGPSALPVCWLMCGLLGGYLSAALQRPIYVLEHSCIGQGHPVCCLQAGDASAWDAERLAELQAHFPPLPANEANPAHTDSPPSALLPSADSTLPTARELETRFIARSAPMRRLMDLAQRMASIDSSVIITGESGTGKERLARFIHDQSPRRTGPFIAVNCGAVTESLLESELFGHVRGAFTGAVQDRQGLFEAANGGTLLLDEIGEIPPPMQVKLLRVLQNKEIRRVGESVFRPIDVRVIAATNRDLTADIASARFRKDLYFRLNVVTLHLPLLRERAEDLVPLAHLALVETAKRLKRPPLRLAPTAIRQLVDYVWPGNVRELENLIERAVALAPTTASELLEIPSDLYPGLPAAERSAPVRPLKQVEKDYILSVLHLNAGNQTRTAAQLHIGATTLYRKLKSYGLVQTRQQPVQPTAESRARLQRLDRRQNPSRRRQ